MRAQLPAQTAFAHMESGDAKEALPSGARVSRADGQVWPERQRRAGPDFTFRARRRVERLEEIRRLRDRSWLSKRYADSETL